MSVSDKEIITFLNQMPPEMKQDAIKGMEFLRRMTITDYKTQQIEAAEALITDVQINPNNYSTVTLGTKLRELLGEFEISEDLRKRIKIVEHFVGYRSRTVFNTDGSVESHKYATYDEYLQSKNYREYMEYLTEESPKRKSKKK